MARIDDKSRRETTRTHGRVIPKAFAIGLSVCLVLIFSYSLSHLSENPILKPYRMVPEYDRFMKKIVLSLGIKDTTLDLHLELLRRLPKYAEIILLLPRSNQQAITTALENQPFRSRVKLVAFDTKRLNKINVYFLFPERDKLIDSGIVNGTTMPQGSLWAQDLFEVATKPDGRPLLLISDSHKWFTSYENGSSSKVVSDNSWLGRLSSVGLEVRRLPLTFKGGNILVDQRYDRRIVFSGGDVFRLTRTVWRSTRDSVPTDAEIMAMFKHFLKADEVVVVGKKKVQPSRMFHLDQAMVLLPNGVVGITHVVGKPPGTTQDADEVKEVILFLSELRSTLRRMGYIPVNIDTSTRNVLHYQYYVNGVPYVDALTGRRTFLMPVFPSSETAFERELVKKNTATFESLGYKVIHVPSKSEKLNGGIHCLVNVLE